MSNDPYDHAEGAGDDADHPYASNNDFLDVFRQQQLPGTEYGWQYSGTPSDLYSNPNQIPPGASALGTCDPFQYMQQGASSAGVYGGFPQSPPVQPSSAGQPYEVPFGNWGYQADSDYAPPASHDYHASLYASHAALPVTAYDTTSSGRGSNNEPDTGRPPGRGFSQTPLPRVQTNEQAAGVSKRKERRVKSTHAPRKPVVRPHLAYDNNDPSTATVEPTPDSYTDSDGCLIMFSKRIKHIKLTEKDYKAWKSKSSKEAVAAAHPWTFSPPSLHDSQKQTTVHCLHCPPELDGIELKWSAKYISNVQWKFDTDCHNKVCFYEADKKNGKASQVDFSHLTEYIEWRDGHPERNTMDWPSHGELDQNWRERWQERYPLPSSGVRVIYPGGRIELYKDIVTEPNYQAGSLQSDTLMTGPVISQGVSNPKMAKSQRPLLGRMIRHEKTTMGKFKTSMANRTVSKAHPWIINGARTYDGSNDEFSKVRCLFCPEDVPETDLRWHADFKGGIEYKAIRSYDNRIRLYNRLSGKEDTIDVTSVFEYSAYRERQLAMTGNLPKEPAFGSISADWEVPDET